MGILGGLGGGGLVVGSEVIGGLVIGGLVVSGVGVGGLVVGSLVIGGLDKGGLGVAAGEENTPEPEESKDSPNSGVRSTGMSRDCALGGAGVEPGRCALGGKFKILCR